MNPALLLDPRGARKKGISFSSSSPTFLLYLSTATFFKFLP